MMDTRPVIRIHMAGSITSFRYPHFTQGVHPTLEMPPPSTIYGHICSAVGELIDPAPLAFGYHFTHEGKFIDFKEHLHFDDPVQPFPFDRELLFSPQLTLYIEPVDLLPAFQEPHFPVILGRSQDLMTYCSVDVIQLRRADTAYFEHTLLPLDMAARLGRGTVAATLSRYIDPRRRAYWGTYALLFDKAVWPSPPQERNVFDDEEDMGMMFEGAQIELWIDPDSPTHPKFPTIKRGVWFHRFVD